MIRGHRAVSLRQLGFLFYFASTNVVNKDVYNNLGTEASSGSDKGRAEASRVDCSVSGRVQRPVDVFNVHQWIQLLRLFATEDV